MVHLVDGGLDRGNRHGSRLPRGGEGATRALARTIRRVPREPKKLDVHRGDVVEIEGRRYDVVSDGHVGLTLEPAVTVSAEELDRRHGTRPATQEEIDELLGLLPPDGEG